MNWAWTTSLDQVWRSPAFPMWLTLAAAGFFGIIVLITLLRAEKSVANGALTVITLLAIAVAVAATIRGFGPSGANTASGTQLPPAVTAALPALSCIDDMAGEAVLMACEKTLFGSAESSAAAVSYAASRITQLTSFGDVATANQTATPELWALRRAVERDRYGLMAYALQARDHCTPAECAAFRSLTDRAQIAANMDGRVYDGLISRYAPTWNAPPAATAPTVVGAIPGAIPGLAPTMPTGKPTNAEFPSASSTPPVSIMNPEPGAAPASATRAPATTPAPSPAAKPAPAVSAVKKPPPKPRAPTPVQIAPATPAAPPPPPAASND
jgi:hypothetical protein